MSEISESREMAKFERLTAVAAPLGIDNIDTDQIFPARFISKDRRDGMYGRYFLHDLRFFENGRPRPNFVLNEQALSNAKIVVASSNYACGSARPGAIYSHLDYGIQAIIAESYGPLFPTVAFKSGLLTIQLNSGACKRLRRRLDENIGAAITIDLNEQKVIGPDGEEFTFLIDQFVKRMFVEGVNEIDLTLKHVSEIERFEKRHRELFTWMSGNKLQDSE
jgi:3-isopropylmalate/(R)-2-methylmalate dehydratase small subunit